MGDVFNSDRNKTGFEFSTCRVTGNLIGIKGGEFLGHWDIFDKR